MVGLLNQTNRAASTFGHVPTLLADGFSPEMDDVVVPPIVPGASGKAPLTNSELTILFADDDSSLQKFVAKLLNSLGYKVILACDGSDALQKARDFSGKIDLLLSDVEMPGMTGIELAIQLDKERPDMKVLLISGMDTGMLVLNNGWAFLPKPFMADMLRDRIRDFLSEQPRNEDLPRD